LHTQSKYRLLVVRLGAMGDVLHALPAVTALRQAHPSWVIDWVIEPAWCALLTANCDVANPGLGPAQPVVDRLHLASTKAWRHHPLSPQTRCEMKALRQALRGCGYDAVLDFQGAVRSAAVARMTGCGRRIGESKPREWAARWLFTERVVTHGAHVIEQDVELATAVAGDELTAVQPWLPIDGDAEAWCDTLLPRSGQIQAVLLNPGAGWGAKRWPVERYAAVARALADQGFRILLNSGPGEEPLANAIREQADGAAQPCSCSVSQLIALTRRVALVIAGDTGPLHLASALGRPVVGIYGPTDPARNGPFGTRSRVLRSRGSRRDHSRRSEPEAGLLTITPEAVLQAAGELLAGDSQESGDQAKSASAAGVERQVFVRGAGEGETVR
jgi:heptosyltransferase-1